jgi:isopenicillin N synthase-like dioxygenase
VPEIPVIDVSDMGTSAAADAAIERALLAAYGIWGFAYVNGHPIAPDLIDRVFAVSRAFHALPLAQKLDIELDGNHRGFIPMRVSTDVRSSVEAATKPNVSESFMMMRESEADSQEVMRGDYLAGPNQWPAALPGFRETLEEYNTAMVHFAHSTIERFASALGARGILESAFDPPTTWLRLLHYPPQDPQAPADEYGSAPHRDFGAITLLAQDEVGGLSVRTPQGEWTDVPPRPYTYVMNVGDMLHRWSNGRLLSTPHRVTNRTGRERFSIPFFYDPSVRATIAPLPSCVSPERPPAFTPEVFGDFLHHELEASYQHHQSPNS